MPTWSYAPVSQSEQDEEEAGIALPTRSSSERGSKTPLYHSRIRGSGTPGFDAHDEDLISKRMPYCISILILIAIVYVLSRTEEASQCQSFGGEVEGGFDIGAYRRERLSQTTPHIIECKEAGEGGSQAACHLPRSKRYGAVGQKGVTLWMTGLSGSGKSTIAAALEEALVLNHGKHVYRLDGDNIRTGLNRDLGFTADDRAESVRRVGELSCLFSDSGTVTIVSLVSPYRDDRDAVRARHEQQGIPFLEVFMDVPLDVVKGRDPKGLYAAAEAGDLKHFTGVDPDSPYEAPLNAELVLPNYSMTVEQCVKALMRALETRGILTGAEMDGTGLPMPDGDQVVDLHLSGAALELAKQEVKTLPKALLSDIDVQWLQVVGEGWASPLKGFMREGALLQTLHFNSYLTDPHNVTGNGSFNERQTDYAHLPQVRPPDRVSSSVPIVLPCTSYTKRMIEGSGKQAVALVSKNGETLAILRNPEIYANRKEEIVTRVFGVIDPGHPYIDHINSGGDWLIGGEIELLQRIRYNDGLDQWRLTAKEVRAELAAKGADVVYAFQTRNPTHAGHAYIMNAAGDELREQGYKKPVLWLSPLGGWTKKDDVPLDVRVKQHEAIIEAGMLDKESTIMAIWPAPMIYAGPTEVQFHAKSRRSGGASFFVVGRDPAGMKGSELAVAHANDDLYDPQHGRYVLALSPGVGSMKMLDFSQVSYDKKSHTMAPPDPSRQGDFLSISGTTMRTLAKQGAVPCPINEPLPEDDQLLAANCIPPGFMAQAGWEIVCDYYQHIHDPHRHWIPYSLPVMQPSVDVHASATGVYGTSGYQLALTGGAAGRDISPWHDVPLSPEGAPPGVFNMVVEIPMLSTAKMEIQATLGLNPIKQDLSDGVPRYYTYGTPLFNYGLLPQTWEDPHLKDNLGRGGDNDPLDVVEIGDGPLLMGSVVPVKVLGSLELIDQGETDHKVIAIRESDPQAGLIESVDDLERLKPGTLAMLLDWMKNYKTSDGKPPNIMASDIPRSKDRAQDLIQSMHRRWASLRDGEAEGNPAMCLGGATLETLGQHCPAERI